VNLNDEPGHYLCPKVRFEIEQRYYARINAGALFERLIHNPEFLRDPRRHPGLWSDHGVVHVQDVARQIIKVLDVAHGVLVPERSRQRFHFMKAYGVLVAYIHDIGMFDTSAFGRLMHPEYAAQAVMGSEFDDLFAALQADDCGGLLEYIAGLGQRAAFQEPPLTVLREMSAMAMCHSKSKVPVRLLNAPEKLRQQMQHTITTDLRTLYQEHQTGQAQLIMPDGDGAGAFGWLASDSPAQRELAGDVIDTLRALRAADSLRQRGTVLKSSGGYEIMVDQHTAGAIWALRLGEERLFLMESDDPVAAGEANIASSVLERDGGLRIAFHRGAFLQAGATRSAARNAARIVDDILEDVIDSFYRPISPDRLDTVECSLRCEDVPVLLEGTSDNPEFTDLVRQELLLLNPGLRNTVLCVPTLQNASALEVTLYLEGQNLDWNMRKRRELVKRLAASGTKTAELDFVQAFQDVKLVELAAGRILIEANSPAAFVFIPLGEGLKVIPLGGYAPFPVYPWIPLGTTGVIRGAPRNADVVAERSVKLLMIPREIYLRYWHHTYTIEEIRLLFSSQLE
jgi:hypothetical protein